MVRGAELCASRKSLLMVGTSKNSIASPQRPSGTTPCGPLYLEAYRRETTRGFHTRFGLQTAARLGKRTEFTGGGKQAPQCLYSYGAALKNFRRFAVPGALLPNNLLQGPRKMPDNPFLLRIFEPVTC
jgi:hypothetical protein